MPARKNNGVLNLNDVEDSMTTHSGTVAMQATLRQAIFDAVTESDVSDIVKKQVERAKDGDPKALEFIAKYVLGFGQPLTLKQVNVFSDVEAAARFAGGRR